MEIKLVDSHTPYDKWHNIFLSWYLMQSLLQSDVMVSLPIHHPLKYLQRLCWKPQDYPLDLIWDFDAKFATKSLSLPKHYCWQINRKHLLGTGSQYYKDHKTESHFHFNIDANSVMIFWTSELSTSNHTSRIRPSHGELKHLWRLCCARYSYSQNPRGHR